MITVIEKVRFYETDMMGIAHHSNHIRWFECGRCAYLKQAGVDLFELMEEGILFPIKSVSCEYIHPINFDDTIAIETRLTKLSRAQMVYSYRILRQSDGLLLAEGTSQNVFTNRKTGAVTRLHDEAYDRLKAQYDQDRQSALQGGAAREQ
ncbi:thioesterase family protein [uncultured Megasphaera sp.]|uniref:acyl-CoA thioesterase n=1 Tax=uncultured Megasphaera sp. TaxID=165188 RepID=UPI002657F872|nr:thioesterase family protein [uncultured Megasphaera sp.]